MSTKNEPTTTTRSYCVMEIDAPVTITFLDGEAFTAERYILAQKIVTAYGYWIDGTKANCTLIIPMSAIKTIRVKSREVPEAEVPAEHQEAVKNQVKRLGFQSADG